MGNEPHKAEAIIEKLPQVGVLVTQEAVPALSRLQPYT